MRGIIGNVLRRRFGEALGNVDSYDLAGLRFDPATGALTAAGTACKLEPKAADVLALLCRVRGTLVSRQHLLDECWGEGMGSDEALTQAVAQIRRAFETLDAPRDILTTYPKRGYRLAAANAAKEHALRRRHIKASWLALAIIVVALVLILLLAPHWPRHLIRHALGLGPSHAQHQTGQFSH